jgi:hypothetical protein
MPDRLLEDNAMTTFQLGSSGNPVREIQKALAHEGLYNGEFDGVFGGATLAAVRVFQKNKHLDVDGKVGGRTWTQLLGAQDIELNSMVQHPLAFRCLALTGAFETGVGMPDCFCGISGDFDGQGVSFGVMQWNLGTGSLQPLLREMLDEHPDISRDIFGEHFDALDAAIQLGDHAKQDLLEFSRSIQHPVTFRLFEPWKGYATALGRTREFQEIQVRHADRAFNTALEMCDEYGVWSERATALMFDIVTQNGSIGAVTRVQIQGEIKALPGNLQRDELEVCKLKIIANRRAEAANPKWRDDVRRRKLCIASGGGTVHGIQYDLDGQFGIRLAPRAAGAMH